MNHVSEKSKTDVVELCTQRYERRLAEEQVKTRAAIDALRVDLTQLVTKSQVSTLRWTVTLLIVHGLFMIVLKHWM